MIQLGTVYKAKYGLEHVYFVISDPSKNRNQVARVNMTSVRGYQDEDLTCILEPGDHETVEHSSWIFYRRASSVPLKHITDQQMRGEIEIMGSICSEDLLKRLQDGAFRSKVTPKDVKALLREQGFGV